MEKYEEIKGEIEKGKGIKGEKEKKNRKGK